MSDDECPHCGATALESADCALNGCPFGTDGVSELEGLRQRVAALEAERDERLTTEQVHERDKIIAAEAYARGLERAAEIAEACELFERDRLKNSDPRVTIASAIRSELRRDKLPDK